MANFAENSAENVDVVISNELNCVDRAEVQNRANRLTQFDIVDGGQTHFLLTNAEGVASISSSVTAADKDSSPSALARQLDLVVSVALLVLVFPLMVLCAVAVRLSGPGPILFRQTRIGRHGREFTCLKFRTMILHAEQVIKDVLEENSWARDEWIAIQKLTADPRVTWIGGFMRRYCLDELPQLFNVLKGEMSIVGPRPIVADEIRRYGSEFPHYCSVNPGLTGLWQVSGSHTLSYDERVQLDVRYAKSRSVQLDMIILLKTVPTVLFRNTCERRDRRLPTKRI